MDRTMGAVQRDALHIQRQFVVQPAKQFAMFRRIFFYSTALNASNESDYFMTVQTLSDLFLRLDLTKRVLGTLFLGTSF